MCNCPYCGSSKTVKRAFRRDYQRMQCNDCKKFFCVKDGKVFDAVAEHARLLVQNSKKRNAFISVDDDYCTFMRHPLNQLTNSWMNANPSLTWYGMGARAE